MDSCIELIPQRLAELRATRNSISSIFPSRDSYHLCLLDIFDCCYSDIIYGCFSAFAISNTVNWFVRTRHPDVIRGRWPKVRYMHNLTIGVVLQRSSDLWMIDSLRSCRDLFGRMWVHLVPYEQFSIRDRLEGISWVTCSSEYDPIDAMCVKMAISDCSDLKIPFAFGSWGEFTPIGGTSLDYSRFVDGKAHRCCP